MNHDYAHCLDFTEKCPNSCFRAQLVRDWKDKDCMVGVPISWSHLAGKSEECDRPKRYETAEDALKRIYANK